MKSRNYYLVNAITSYRIVMAPVLIWLAIAGHRDAFTWLLPVSFFTDLIDGFLARRLKVMSVLGSKLDSIGDDLTFAAAVVGVFVFKFDFIKDNFIWVSIMLGLYFLQVGLSLVRYRKLTSFHTYLGKTAALFQGCFLILLFLLPEPFYPLFYLAAVTTIVDLVEEILMIFYLKKWHADVKGLYWAIKLEKPATHKRVGPAPKFKIPPGKRRAYGH